MVITKSFDPTTASQGDTVRVDISVQNTGLGTAHDVVIDDVLDGFFDETTAAEVTIAGGFTYSLAGNTITYTGGPIAAGATVNFSFDVALDALVPIGTAIPNTARVTQATTLPGVVPGERDEPDVSGSATLNSVGPDLQLTKNDGITQIAPGAQTTYNLVVTNVGGFQATGVYIDDTLPLATTFVSVGGDVACSDGGLLPGGRRINVAGAIAANTGTVTCTMTIQMTSPAPAGTSGYLNTAVTADDGVNGPDPTPGNNNAQDNDVITGRAPNLVVTKDDGVLSRAPGASTTYTVTVTNVGNIGVTNVLATDTLPAGLAFSSCNSVSGTVSVACSHSGGIVTITYAGIAGGGGSASFEITAIVDDPIGAGIETIDNTVTVADDGANGTDADLTDNTDNDVDTIDAQPDMTVVKSHTQPDVAPGGDVDFQLLVANAGEQNATGVIVSDTVDSQMTIDCSSASPAPTTCNPATGVITWGPGLQDDTAAIAGTFIAGESIELTYTTTADNPLVAGTREFRNDVTVTDDDGTADGDPTPANNLDTDLVPLAANNPELGIVKDDGLTDLVPGQLYTYTLTITNSGNIGSSGVTIVDTLPAEVVFDSCSDSCDATSLPNVTWNLPDLAGGGAQDFVILTVRVVDPAPGGVTDITNVATVSDDGANGADPIPLNNTDDDVDTLVAVPDLVVTKDDGATVRATGEQFDYTINVDNIGDQLASGVVVVDTLPDVLTALSCPAVPVPCTIDAGAGTVTWNVGDLNGGAALALPPGDSSITLTVTVIVDATVASGVTQFTNTARAADDGTNSGGTPVEDTDIDTDDLTADPDLQITKSDGVTNVSPGDTLTYDIAVTNVGSQATTGVTVTDMLPPGVTFVSCSPACDSTALPVVAWTNLVEDVAGSPADSLAFDALGQANLTVVVTVDTPAVVGLETLDNRAVVADDGVNGVDPTPGNNVSNDVDTVDAAPDLLVVKSDGVLSVVDGQTVVYDIEFSNIGNQNATGVVITDVLPAGVSFVSCSDGCDSTGEPTIVWNVGDLDVGDGDTYTLTGQVDDPVTPTTRHFVNNVTITDDGSNGADLDPSNNSDDDDDTYGIDLAVSKTDGETTATPGTDIVYAITVTNNGPTTVQDFELDDTVPPALSGVTFTPSAGTYDRATHVWNDFGDFAEGDTLTLTVRATIDAAATGDLTNTVVVTAPDFVTDTDLTNNTATDTDTLRPVSNLFIDKQLQDDLVLGRRATYAITLRNDGPSVAAGVSVIDVLPSALSYAGVTAPGWTCVNAPSSTVSCALDEPLDVGTTVSFELSVTVVGVGGSTVVNTATAVLSDGVGPTSQLVDSATGIVTTVPAAATTGPLPVSGSDVIRTVYFALLLVIAGGALRIARNARRSRRAS